MLRCRPDLPGFLCLIVGFATLGLRPGVASESRLSPETLNSQGIRALNAGKLAEALRDFKAAQQGNPANSEIAFNVGLTYFRMGQYERAIPPLRRAVSVANPPAKALYLLGVSLYETSDFSASAAELEQLRRVNFQHQDEILYLLEESYRRGKDPAEAKECFQELADKFPDSAFLHKLMGSAYSEQGNERQALVEFKEAVAKNPSLNGVHRAIGIIYLNRHDDAEGSKWLIQEIVLNPCDPASHYYLGEIARKEGRLAAASAITRKQAPAIQATQTVTWEWARCSKSNTTTWGLSTRFGKQFALRQIIRRHITTLLDALNARVKIAKQRWRLRR